MPAANAVAGATPNEITSASESSSRLERGVLLPPARHAAVVRVEDQRRGRHGREKVRDRGIGDMRHRKEHRGDAAARIGEREEIGQVKAADHREVPGWALASVIGRSALQEGF